MQVTNFRVTTSANPSNTIIYGTSFSVAFTVQREAGDIFNNALQVWLPTGTTDGEMLICWEHDFSLAVGESKELELTSFVAISEQIETLLTQQRAVPLNLWGVTFGAYASRANVVFPVNIVQGWLPQIEAFSALRCIDGVEDDEGEELMCDLKLSAGSLAEPEEMFLDLYYSDGQISQEAPHIELASSIPAGMEGLQGSLDLVTQTFSNGSTWQLALVFGDEYEKMIVFFDLPSAFANVHLSGCRTGGVAFGKFSASQEGSPKFECEYPAVFDAPVTFNGGVSGIPRIECGFIEGTQSIGSNAYRDYPITFQKAYQNLPVVICGFWSGATAGGFGRCSAAAYNVSKTGCVARVFNGDSSSRTPSVMWAALGT